MAPTSKTDRSSAIRRLKSSRRVVLKVGTSLLTRGDDVNRPMIEKLRDEILFLRGRGIDVLLVTSGAVGMGRGYLREIRPDALRANPSVARRQALSALGQNRLMAVYSEVFATASLPVAQLLITARDFRDRRAYLNIGNTIEELNSLAIVPIVNENDTVSTAELNYGDNDLLSAACASLFRADALIILTSAPGFLMDGRRLDFLSELRDEHFSQAGDAVGPGSGGMKTKLRAGQLCLMSGELLAILPGTEPNPVSALFNGDDIGTVIAAARNRRRLSARKRWLLYAQSSGEIIIDEGARRALAEKGSSLLPAGIVEARGHFLAGDVVELRSTDNAVLGRGITNYSYREILPLRGLNSEAIRSRGQVLRAEEVIHRNNLVIESVLLSA